MNTKHCLPVASEHVKICYSLACKICEQRYKCSVSVAVYISLHVIRFLHISCQIIVRSLLALSIPVILFIYNHSNRTVTS